MNGKKLNSNPRELLKINIELDTKNVPRKMVGYVRGLPFRGVRIRDIQRIELLRRGVQVDNIFEDCLPGFQPNFQKALKRLKKGDTFVFWRFDVLGISKFDAGRTLSNLLKEGKNFVSIEDNFTSFGKPHIFLFDLIENRREGFEKNKEGFCIVNKLKTINLEQIKNAVCKLNDGMKFKNIAEDLGLNYGTLHNTLRKIGAIPSIK